jgi:hypothetical protein
MTTEVQPTSKTTITAYVSTEQKQQFLRIKRDLDKTMRVPQTALAQLALSQFIDRYAGNVKQLIIDFGNA